ncbi:MAG: PilZ domain-containing protein [Candidatus Omnitrophota bacterium]
MRERRRFIRIKEKDIINYKILPNYKTEKNITEDLSIGGIKFFSNKFIPFSSVLLVEIKLEHAHKILTIIVKVKWIRQKFDDELYELGAEFIDVSSEDLKFLNGYLYNEPNIRKMRMKQIS